ncbi:hypothetical protein [Rossellomorea vietnamensis]|uniref:hypothetical protein n=1 Tax=Rossellomorea vietnamensis TaxID=218284 RepID=UPI001E55DF71|nr:hypothetical protein [Rossellomorea vietnamensis]MCC5802250.1 hypothetical protein [Rossellomorea vietnamensis]
MSWKDIEINGFQIEKCVGEFEVTALDYFEDVFDGDEIHYGAFKVKVYESQVVQFSEKEYNFIGYTNLQVKDSTGTYESGVGYGKTLEIALENTIQSLKSKIEELNSDQKGLTKPDFNLVSYDEY